MRKSFLIAHSNIRKAKGQTIAIVVLILIASLMLNIWLMLSMDYKANFNRYHDKLNAEHITLSVDDYGGEIREFLSQTLGNDTRVKEYELDSCMHMIGTFPYNGGTMNSWFVFMKKETAINRPIGKSEIVEDSDQLSGIYLPMLYKNDDIDVGKSIEISIGSNTIEFTICGFFNSIMMGSHNCGLTQIILTQDKYAELENLGFAQKCTVGSVRLKDISENLKFESFIKSEISKQYPDINILSSSYDIVSQSRYISQMVCSGIVSVMAFLVLLIALVVIASNIINYIQVNLKNLGSLKAVGYTSKQITNALLLQFISITLFTAIVGTVLSYLLFPVINEMMIAQTGIPYVIHFLPLPLILSLLILCGSVALVVWLASRRIKKVEPIVALRFGIKTHNFKKNYVPLDKTKLSLNIALALKTTFSNVKHNITIFITMLVISLIVVFSGLITQNIIMDVEPFLNLIIGETADSCISIQNEVEDDFIEFMSSDSRVQKFYLYTSMNVSHFGGAELLSTISDDFSKVNNSSVIYKGRFPKYDNEIAIAGKYAKEKGFEVGDIIEITANGKLEKFLICGFTQISNNLGRDCLLTRQGYMRLGVLSSSSYYINLTDDTNIDEFNQEIKEMFIGNVNTTINILTTIDGASSVYVSLMTVIVIAVLFLSAIIIAFVLYLLVRTMLNNKKSDYGIMKSLGFTTKQLILQTALSFMPAIILSSIIGFALNSAIINPLMSLFLSPIGVVKCTFLLPVGFIICGVIGIVIISFGIACLLSLRIKNITPRTLIVGE